MSQENLPSGKKKRSGWFWAFLILGILSVLAILCTAGNTYFYPCSITGNIRASLPCEVSDSARWWAVGRDSFGTLCCMLVPFIVLTLLWLMFGPEAKARRAAKLAAGDSKAPISPDQQ